LVGKEKRNALRLLQQTNMHQPIPSAGEVATRQLSMAIQLYLNKGDLICAITLAGAAEEILGKMAIKKDMPSALEQKVERTKELFKQIFPNKAAPPDKEFISLVNLARNMMKHLKDENELPPMINLDDKAGRLIKRAIQNYSNTIGMPTAEMRHFERERLQRIKNEDYVGLNHKD